MSNLYEILEVSEKASKEVIDKAYHVLAKKYHPDLQQGEAKQKAEEKMKQINAAYEILGNDEKRKEYDAKLEAKKLEERQIREKRQQEEIQYKQEQKQQTINEEDYEYNNAKKLQEEMNRAYANAYNNYLRSLGYKVREPWTFKKFINLLKVLGILAIAILIIWIFPPTHKMLVDLYTNNNVIKAIINVLGNIIQGLWNGIKNFFIRLFS